MHFSKQTSEAKVSAAVKSGGCVETPLIINPAVALNVCVQFRAGMSLQLF